jgi:integrase
VAKPTVKLFIRIRRADGAQMRVKPAYAKNYTLRPFWAVVNGKEEHHPEGTYVIRFRDRNGRRCWLSVGNDVDAALAAKARKEKEISLTKMALELNAEVSGLGESGTGSRRILLSEAFAEYLADIRATKAPKTACGRKRVTEYFQESCGKRYLDEIGRRDLLEFRRFLYSRGLADRTVFNVFQAILTVFRALGRTGLVLKSDWPSYTERAVRAYSEQELAKLFAACDDEERLLFQTFLFSGCREQEVQFLTYPDVDSRNRTIAVRAKEDLGFRVKDREERLIPIPQKLVDTLEERRRVYPNDRFIFPAKNGQPNGHMLRSLKKVALRAGINCGHCKDKAGHSCAKHAVCKNITLHSFRRSFATMHFEAGVRAHTLRRWLGHSDLDTTLRYLAVADVRSEGVRSQVESTFSSWAVSGTLAGTPRALDAVKSAQIGATEGSRR